MKIMFGKFRGKLKAKRKGVTPVIAIVLLLMMTVAAAGMAYVFIQQVQTEAQDSTTDALAQTSSDMSAALSIDSVWNAGGITFVLRNDGSHVYTATELTQLKIMVDGVPQAATCTGLAGRGSTCTVSTGVTFPANAGDTKVIKVSPPVGADITYNCRIKTTGATYC